MGASLQRVVDVAIKYDPVGSGPWKWFYHNTSQLYLLETATEVAVLKPYIS